MTFIVYSQEKFGTNSTICSINIRNKYHLHRPVTSLAFFQKSMLYAQIRIVSCFRQGWTMVQDFPLDLLLDGNFKMFPELLYFWEIQNHSHLSYISFKIFPLCNYILLATVKVLETFLETILWKPFKHLLPILSDVPSLLISVKGTGKNQLELGQESVGDALD